MRLWKDRLRSPEWWFNVGLLVSALGLALFLLGYRTLGKGLMVPFVIELAAILIAIPGLLFSNWNLRRKRRKAQAAERLDPPPGSRVQ